MTRRLAGALLAAALVLAGCTDGRPAPADTAGGAAPHTATSAATPAATPDPSALLAGPDAAADAGAAALLRAGSAVATGAWARLTDPEWRDRVAGRPRPVYVADVSLTTPPAPPGAPSPSASPSRTRASTRGVTHVEADVVIAARPADLSEDRAVLRLLPAAEALGVSPEVTVTVDGQPVEAGVDAGGARLLVPLPGGADGPVRLRVELAYDVPPLKAVTTDGGPAGFGLLARRDGTTTLAHWLPLLTLPDNRGPMVSFGDVGAFPAAVWSVRVHGAQVVTGGAEGPCPQDGGACVWARGVGLRDLSAVVPPADAAHASEGSARAVAPPGRDAAPVLAEVRAALRSYRRRLGPLPWRQLDTVAVPLRSGAAGMELPGLSLIDTDAWGQLNGGFGTYVIAHEVAHQWFHALVGNGSLSDPVVDEALAQYLTVLHERDARGPGAAERMVERFMRTRYRAALAGGLEPAAPARPLRAFAGADAYGALVYGRAPLGLLAAEDAAGAGPVAEFLAGVVDRHGLGVVTDDRLRGEAADADPAIGDALGTWWFRPRLPDGALSG